MAIKQLQDKANELGEAGDVDSSMSCINEALQHYSITATTACIPSSIHPYVMMSVLCTCPCPC